MKDMMMKMDAAIVQGEPTLVQASMSQVEMTVWLCVIACAGKPLVSYLAALWQDC